MRQGRRTLIGILASGIALGLAPGVASAATVLGQTTVDPMFDDCGTMTNPYTEVQVSTGAAPSYTVPAGGGVITSWSHQGGPNEAGELKLKVYRPTANPDQYTVVGHSQQTMVANTLTTTDTRIPALAGDVLGYTRLVGSVMSCLFTTPNAGDGVKDAPNLDTPDNQTSTFGSTVFTNLRINISAVLESDLDGDGYGDESQDNCVGASNPAQSDSDVDGLGDVCDNCPTLVGASANNGCPPVLTPAPLSPTTTPTAPGPPKKKKCKKPKKRPAGAAKKCKKRKR